MGMKTPANPLKVRLAVGESFTAPAAEKPEARPYRIYRIDQIISYRC
jgi:hypothetical protein